MPLSVNRTVEECRNVSGCRFRRIKNSVCVHVCVAGCAGAEAFPCFSANGCPGTQFSSEIDGVIDRREQHQTTAALKSVRC